jgi:hypothetical protein
MWSSSGFGKINETERIHSRAYVKERKVQNDVAAVRYRGM